MNIQIIVSDENLNYLSKAEALSFESAVEMIGKLERNYNRRVEMELSKADVHGEASKEETF